MDSKISNDDQFDTAPREDNIHCSIRDSPKINQQKRISEIPPFWQPDSQSGSKVDTERIENHGNKDPIILEDNTQKSDRCSAVWAKRVSVDDYTIISGTNTHIGDYVVWNCTVETLSVCLFAR